MNHNTPVPILYTAEEFRCSVPSPGGTRSREACSPAPPAGEHALWFALRARTNLEVRVADALSHARIEHFLPARTEIRRWSDRRQTITVPIFPGYLFARFLRIADAAQVLATTGVLKILGHGESDCVSQTEIDSMRIVAASPLPLSAAPFIGTGKTVTIMSGPLVGVTGTVVRRRGRARVIVSCELLQRAISVDVAIEDVKELR